MKNRSTLPHWAALLTAGFLSVTSLSAATLTFQPFAPTPGSNDIFNLTGSTSDAGNVNGGDDAAEYVAFDRGAQGQTFTTGTNGAGYQVRAVWLRHITYGPSFWYLPPGGTFIIRVTDPAQVNNAGFVLATETYTTTGNEPNTLSTNFTIGGTGAGTWLRFSLATPVALAANTIYGFDVASQSANGGFNVNPFFETDGTNGNPYASGVAYVSGAAGVPGLDMVLATNGVADHAFLVEMVGAAVAPNILTHPQNQIVAQGASASFSVAVGGTAPFTYQWFFNSTNSLNSQTNATLTIAGVTTNLSQIGNYSVVVANEAGSRTSTVARLSVVLPSTTLNLSFTGGTGILDSNSVATPFTTRLAGTGASLPIPDTNLLLDANALEITSTTCDFFGQVLMDQAEAPGINLSAMGFDGTQDFSVTGTFTNLVSGANYDQVGVFVGASSTNFVRAGLIYNSDFAATPGSYGVTTPNNFDAGIVTAAAPVDEMIVTVLRSRGNWSITVNGLNVTPTAPLAFLNGYTDLTSGIFALDTAGDHHNVARLEKFSANLYVPKITATTGGGNLTIKWNVFGAGLESNTNLANANGWTAVPAASTSPYVVPVPTSGNRFYRLAQ